MAATADRSVLVLALLLSVLLHGALVVLVPGMTLPEPEEELLEFEMRAPQERFVPEPEPLEPPEEAVLPEEAPLPQETELAEPVQSAEPADPPELPEAGAVNAQPTVSALDSERLTDTLRSELPVPPANPPKAVWLPERRTQRLTAETIMVSSPRQSVEELSGTGELKRAEAALVERGADMRAARATVKKLLASLGKLPSSAKGSAAGKEKTKAPGAPEIGGEVGSTRTVVRHPPPPTVKIDNPVTVEMEFWVSPAGDVIRAHALRTGEAALDREAAQYVKGFKFNALDSGDTGQQRGTILVRFSWR